MNANDTSYNKIKYMPIYNLLYPYDHYLNVINKWVSKRKNGRSNITTIDEFDIFTTSNI